MSVDIKVPNYSSLIKGVMDKTVRRVLIEVENKAKLTSPVDTGYYRNNINRDEASKEVVANAEYSALIEYGVSNTRRKPNPVMRNSAREVQAQVDDIFLREMKKV